MGRLLPGSIALALLLVACARKESPPVDVTDEYLNARVAVLRADVEAVLHARLPDDLKVRVVSTDEMEESRARAGIRMLSRIEGGPRGEALEEECRRNASLNSGHTHACVDLETGEIAYCVENVREMVGILPSSIRLLAPERLDLTLIHELVHVYQHQRGVFRPAANWDAKYAQTALLEGHADFVTREVAKRRDLTEFIAYESSEEIGDESARYLERIGSASNRFSYARGERFFAEAVRRLGYRKAVERLFAHPPTDTTMISWPERYFDPVPLPEGFERLGPTVRDWVRESRPGAAWYPDTRTQIEADLGLLEPDEVARALKGLVKSIVIADQPELMITISCFETDEAALRHRNLRSKLADVLHRKCSKPTSEGVRSMEHHTETGDLDGVPAQMERTSWLVHGGHASWHAGLTRLVDGPIFIQVAIREMPLRFEYSKRTALRVLQLTRANSGRIDSGTEWLTVQKLARTGQDIERLREFARAKDAEVRLAAFQGLHDAGALGSELQERAASDPDAEIRERAVGWIDASTNPESADRLVARLEAERDPRPLAATFKALKEIDAHRRIPWKAMRDALRQGDPALRLAALGCWSEPEYNGRAPLQETRELLLEMIRDWNPRVQEKASELMIELAPTLPGFPEAWLHAMKSRGFFVQSRAQEAFEKLGDQAAWAVDDLVELLDRDYPDGECAALALAGIGEPAAKAEPRLRTLYKEGPKDNRGGYAVAIARVAHDVRPLLECLDSGEWRGRLEVIETIGELKVGAAIPKLIELLESKDDALAAAEALGVIRAEAAIPALERLIARNDSSAVYTARKALEAIRSASKSN